jgi:hypothetical protein
MRIRTIALFGLVLSSCGPITPSVSIPPKPAALSTQDLVSTVVASGPKIEVSFDGVACSIAGPTELPTGTLYTQFTNTTGHIATPWLGRCYAGKGWEDLLDWIGPPGAIYHKETPPWFALQNPDKNVSESPSVSYRQYSLKIKAEYIIFIEYPSDYWWPCGSFRVDSSS